MYAETPVVAYDVGGVSEIVLDGETGYLVPAGDERQFVSALVDAVTSDTSRMEAQAKQQVLDGYTNTAIAKRFLDVYQQVIHAER